MDFPGRVIHTDSSLAIDDRLIQCKQPPKILFPAPVEGWLAGLCGIAFQYQTLGIHTDVTDVTDVSSRKKNAFYSAVVIDQASLINYH